MSSDTKEHKEVEDPEYQQFLDTIPRYENAYKVHRLMTEHFKKQKKSNGGNIYEEEKKDDGVIIYLS